MGKVIAVVSGKGGTGKTTSAAAISSCLAALGKKTLCIDFDAGLKNLDLALCMTDFAVMDYMDVLKGDVELVEACSESPQISDLFFIAAPTVFNQEDEDAEALKAMFDEVRQEFDFCIIDAPSGVGKGFRQAITNADMSIIVTTGELPAMRDAQHAASIICEMGAKDVRLLVNRVIPKNLKRIKTTVDDLIDTVGAKLIGIVPEDKSVFRALHAGSPLIRYKKRFAAYDYLDVAHRILGDEVPLRRW
ncbi:MAG: AAA family ATPase [Oscillospiraceae bacterium]|nr:AAA family ATPase [Oscillospiraceae bacterium]